MSKQIGIEEGLYYRPTFIDQVRRVIIRVDGAIFTADDGVNLTFVNNLAKKISFLQDSDREVSLVTSGAATACR